MNRFARFYFTVFLWVITLIIQCANSTIIVAVNCKKNKEFFTLEINKQNLSD